MDPYSAHDRKLNGSAVPSGPHPSFIQVAKPYLFEHQIQECLNAIGVTEAKEDNARLVGVAWIDNVRKALQLPVRTYNTAVIYYHKFRLVHPPNEYDLRDVAAAALFAACKVEDTLKKSRDILCTAYNLKISPTEQLSSDDVIFESHSKTILGLERLVLEASGFDFRSRYPQKILMKLLQSCHFDKTTIGITAYKILLDLYRTFAPLKQTTQTMALAGLELAVRLCSAELECLIGKNGIDHRTWATSRAEIMETLVDLLDLYTRHRANTAAGLDYSLDDYIKIRIELNQEAKSRKLPRYTEWKEPPETNGKMNVSSPGALPANGFMITPKSISPQSPSPNNGSISERGKDGTIRFMLNPTRARDEKAAVREFFKPEEVVEEEVEIEVPVTPTSSPPHSPRTVSPPIFNKVGPQFHRKTPRSTRNATRHYAGETADPLVRPALSTTQSQASYAPDVKLADQGRNLSDKSTIPMMTHSHSRIGKAGATKQTRDGDLSQNTIEREGKTGRHEHDRDDFRTSTTAGSRHTPPLHVPARPLERVKSTRDEAHFHPDRHYSRYTSSSFAQHGNVTSAVRVSPLETNMSARRGNFNIKGMATSSGRHVGREAED